MITPANQLQKTSKYQKELEIVVQSMVRQINSANEKGRSATCWNPTMYYKENGKTVWIPESIEHDAKRMFKQQGYRFEPTGYIGGVWQLTQNICW